MEENKKAAKAAVQAAEREKRSEALRRTAVAEFQKVRVGKIVGWAVILLLFLIITNPSLLPFLSAETKESVKETWVGIFGDVGKIAETFSLNWITAFRIIAIILLMILVTTIIQFILEHIHARSPKGRSAVTLLRSAISYVTTLVAFFWCISAMGVNVSTIFASVGIVALIIGFGAQSLVEDLVTGIFLVFEDQFNVGDIIEVNDFRGTVESIGIRTTAIRDVGNNIKIINNSDLRNILNRSTNKSVAVTTVSVSYQADLEKVEEAIEKMLPQIQAKYPEVFGEVPRYIGVQELGESGVVLKFVATVEEKNVFSAPRLLNREIKVYFDKNGIEIPFNQIVVHEAKG